MKHFLIVVGARPQFIKVATLFNAHRALGRQSGLRLTLVNTGQHYDTSLSDDIFDDLSIQQAKYNLNIGRSSQAIQLSRIISSLEPILKKEKPDCVIVFGDTTSTLAGAMSASLGGIPLVHIESGLRSWDARMPEERNRVITDDLSQYLFCPTTLAVENLKKSSARGKVYNIGDVMADLLYYTVKKKNIKRNDQNYYLATIHRNTNTDNIKRLSSILKALGYLDKEVRLVMHPRTQAVIKQSPYLNRLCQNKTRLIFLKPVNYSQMLELQAKSTAVITDSGGLQKEAYLLNVPCITLRQNTEWVETIELGRNSLCEPNPKEILKQIRKQTKICANKPKKIYGNGNSALKILKILRKDV